MIQINSCQLLWEWAFYVVSTSIKCSIHIDALWFHGTSIAHSLSSIRTFVCYSKRQNALNAWGNALAIRDARLNTFWNGKMYVNTIVCGKCVAVKIALLLNTSHTQLTEHKYRSFMSLCCDDQSAERAHECKKGRGRQRKLELCSLVTYRRWFNIWHMLTYIAVGLSLNYSLQRCNEF